MPQRFRDIGDIRSCPLQHRSERMPGRIGRDIADPELFAHLLHTLIDRTGEIHRFTLPPHCILLSVENRKNEAVGPGGVAPSVNYCLHPLRDNDPDFLAGLGRAFGLLPHKAYFTIHNVPIPQLYEIGNVDPVTQVEEQPIITVFGRRFGPVVIPGYLSYLLQRKGQFAALALLYLVFIPTEWILRLLDNPGPLGVIENYPDMPHMYGDRRLYGG